MDKTNQLLNAKSDETTVICEQCGYSLIGSLESRRCPECGLEFNPSVLRLARIPWLHRASLGSVKAYIQTIRMVFLRPEVIAGEFQRLVRIGLEDAEKFRKVSVRIAVLSGGFLVGSVQLRLLMIDPLFHWPKVVAASLFLIWSLLVFLIFYHLISRPPTLVWAFLNSNYREPPGLFEYTAAPLALTPIMDVIGAIFVIVAGDANDILLWLGLYLLISGIMLTILFWYVFAVLLGKVCKLDFWVVSVSMPLHWGLTVLSSIVVGVGLIPLIAIFAVLF